MSSLFNEAVKHVFNIKNVDMIKKSSWVLIYFVSLHTHSPLPAWLWSQQHSAINFATLWVATFYDFVVTLKQAVFWRLL